METARSGLNEYSNYFLMKYKQLQKLLHNIKTQLCHAMCGVDVRQDEKNKKWMYILTYDNMALSSSSLLTVILSPTSSSSKKNIKAT